MKDLGSKSVSVAFYWGEQANKYHVQKLFPKNPI